MYKKLLISLSIFLSSLFLFSNNVSATSNIYTYSSNVLPTDVTDFLNSDLSYTSLITDGNSGVVWQNGGNTYSTNDNTIGFAIFDSSLINVKFYDVNSVGIKSIIFYDSSNNSQNYTSSLVTFYVLYYDSESSSYSWEIVNSPDIWNNYYNFYIHTSYGGYGSTGSILKSSVDITDKSSSVVLSKNWSFPLAPLVTSEEIFEKTGKTVSQSAIDDCYSNNRNFMLVYSEGTNQYIGDYAFLCATAPTTYILTDNTTWGQGFQFAYFDTTFHHVNDTASRVLYKNGTGSSCEVTTQGTCGQWGRKNYFTYYYSNFDVRYDWEGHYSSSAGQVKFSCNADSCLSTASNDFAIVMPDPEITYDHTLSIMPYYYNYAYIKFKGIGNLEAYLGIVESVMTGFGTEYKSYFYDIYKNGSKERTMVINHNNNNYSISYLFENSTLDDTYLLVFPFTNMKGSNLTNPLRETDILDIKFTIPGVIEYGTDQNVYYVNVDSDGNTSITEDGNVNRDEITDLLDPPDVTPEEIISTPSSTNTLTNDSLNEFSWPYSLFSRDGANITDIKLSASYSNTNSLNINNFENRLVINYGSEIYKINLNNCMLNDYCNLTAYEKTLIKRILFDRNVETSNEYLSFSTKPLTTITTSNSAQLNIGLSLEFSSSVELTISSFLLAVNDISNGNYNVYFKLYDNAGNVHTLYKTALDVTNHVGVNQFLLDNRTADIYKVELMFVYNHTSTTFNSLDHYHLDFNEFNIFANTDLIHIYTDNTNISYQTCAWNNFFCHIQNGFTWLVYEAPILKDFWIILKRITNIFNIIWQLLTYILMPLDIIPPILGVNISSLALSLIALYLIIKLWIGGKS